MYEEAQNKGWEVRIIDYLKCTIEIMKNELVVNYEGEILKVPDAIIPRIGASKTPDFRIIIFNTVFQFRK